MPIVPSQPGLWPEGHEGNSQHCTSLPEVSVPKLPPDYENNSQKPVIQQAPIEITRNFLYHAQGEPSPNDTPDLTMTSSTSSSEQSSVSDNKIMPYFGNHFFFNESTNSMELPGWSHSSWDEIEPDFDTPLILDTSNFSLDRIYQCKHNSQPSAFNANNKEGEPSAPPPIARSPDSLTGKFHEEESTGKKLCRLNTDDIKPPLGESTEGPSLSNSTPGSADESTTSSDYEDDIASDTSDDILKSLIEPLLQKLLSAYSRYTLGKKSGEGEAKESNDSDVPDSAISVATGKQTIAGYQYPRISNPTKRKRQDLSQNSGNGEDEDEEEELPPRKRVEPLKEGVLLACPFSKWKPLSYQSCYKYIMKDIRRVKQHLRRNHKRPLHCPTCCETFKVEETFYSHIEGRSCLPQPKKALEGVTSTQQEHLDRKVDRKLSRSDQWYSIFSILFPDSQLPRSAYLESDLSAELLDFQKFMATDGLEIVEQTVHEQIPASLIPQTEEIVTFSQVLFQQAIPEILKKYEATRPHNSSPDSGYESIYPPNSSHSMPDEHKVDEGARMEPLFETINPTLKDPSLADYTTSCDPDDLLVPDDNVPIFLDTMMGMEEFLSSDTAWGEGV